jgi:hypothetical protein
MAFSNRLRWCYSMIASAIGKMDCSYWFNSYWLCIRGLGMKSTRQMIFFIAIMLLLVVAMVVWFVKSAGYPPSVPAAVPDVSSVTPTNPEQPGAVQSSTDDGEATPEFVAEPVSEAAVDEHKHEHGDKDAVKPSAEIIQAIRDIKKPAEGEGQVTEYPDGSVGINLGNRYHSVPVATIGKDGKLHVDYHGEKYLQEDNQQEIKKPDVQKIEVKNP